MYSALNNCMQRAQIEFYVRSFFRWIWRAGLLCLQGTNVVAEQQKHDDRSTHCEENSIFEEKNEDKASYGGAEANDVPFENSNSPVSQLEKEQY